MRAWASSVALWCCGTTGPGHLHALLHEPLGAAVSVGIFKQLGTAESLGIFERLCAAVARSILGPPRAAMALGGLERRRRDGPELLRAAGHR